MRDSESHHVDGLIDEVARSMTQAEPSPLLRDRVLARIAGTSAERVRVSGAQAWRLGLAAASIAIVLVVVLRHGSSPLPEADVRQPAQDVQLRARTEAGGGGVDGGVSGLDAGTGDRNAPRPVRGIERRPEETDRAPAAIARFQTAPAEEPPEELPFPPVEVETVAIEPLSADAMTLEAIELPMPLQVQRLTIDPVVLQ